MKMTLLFGLALLAMSIGAMQNANAGAAVVIGPDNRLATAYGGPIRVVKELAFAEARRKYGPNVEMRIFAATDETGYGAIAVARHPNGVGSIIGVSLGKRSATEADTLAVDHCLKAGGINPQVKWGFRG